MKAIVLSTAAILLTSLTCSAGVADFARTSLRLDLTAYPFGASPDHFVGYEKDKRWSHENETILHGKCVPDGDTLSDYRIDLRFVQDKLVEVSIVWRGKEHNDEIVRGF